MSPEVKCLHAMSLQHKMCMMSVNNVIYHKFLLYRFLYVERGAVVEWLEQLGYGAESHRIA